MAQKPSLLDLMVQYRISNKHGLAAFCGIDPATAEKAINGHGENPLNISSVTKIARAFGLEPEDINWRSYVSHRGRPAGSGGTYVRTRP